MDIIEKIRQIPNPYEPVQVQSLTEKQFIGRENILALFQDTLKDFEDTGFLTNVLVVGPKTIGKSILLDRFHAMSEGNLATFKIELSETKTIDTIDFFIRIIDQLIIQFKDSENFLPKKQIENWFEAIHGEGPTLNYVESFFKIPLIKSKSAQTANEEEIENDLGTLIDYLISSDSDVDGMYLFIDEFQEFKNNPHLIEIITRLSGHIQKLGIVGAGRLDIYNHPDVFERFIRSAKTKDIGPLGSKNGQIRDAVILPIVGKLGCMYHEAEELFDIDSLSTLEQKTGGNPLHIRLLCSEMFNEFKYNTDAEAIKLDRVVLELAMKKYQGWSKKSRLIQTALSTCSKDQFKAFSRLYFYEGMDIRSIVIHKMSFDNITTELEENCLSIIKNDFHELQSLQLFNVTDVDGEPVSISTVDDLTPTKAHKVKFEYMGDEFDRLYASYYYQWITGNDLEQRFSRSLVDLLAQDLGENLTEIIVKEEINDYESDLPPINFLFSKSDTSFEEALNIIKEISQKDKLSPENISKVHDISKQYNLEIPSILANHFNFQGYYVVSIDVLVRGNERVISSYFPVSSEVEIKELHNRTLNRSSYISASLDDYNIEIKNIYLFLIPKQVTVLVLSVKTTDNHTKLIDLTDNNKFNDALKEAEKIMDLSLTHDFTKRKSFVSISSVNDYAFCLINVGDLSKAEKNLKNISKNKLISAIDLAYVELMLGKYNNARSQLKKTYLKVKHLSRQCRFIHLAIIHDGLDHGNKMVRDVSYDNICAWNLMLISSYRNEIGAYDAFKNWPKPRDENEKFIHRRVLHWVKYYFGKKEEALSSAKKLFKDLNKESHLYKDVELDIKIISE